MTPLKLLLTLVVAAAAHGQTSAIEDYLQNADVKLVSEKTPANRTDQEINGILPLRLSQRFADYAAARLSFGSLRQAVENLRLNKLVANTPGPAGATALVSRVSVPSILAFATEYGSILQTNQGNVSTLRGNLLGIARMALGQEQFPYCPEIDQKNCQTASKWLRRISGALSFGSVRDASATATAAAANTPPTPVTLFGSDYRMASWGSRFDLTANDPNDPKYVPAWRSAIANLRGNPQSAAFTQAINDLFESAVGQDLYQNWQAETVGPLKAASSAEFAQVLEQQLDILITRMAASDPDFQNRIVTLRRTFMNYAMVRDDLLKEIQSHRASMEYTNQHPVNQPNTSNIRFIYSHQPTRSPTLVTANVAATWYHQTLAGTSTGRFRDLQIAGQLDRRLPEIPNLGNAVVTFGAYYQWMKEDALINIGSGNVAPGSGIVLPNTAATLLGTKGHIGIFQGKLTIPINGALRVPISVTWSNRTELINEKDLRGQIGLTLDLDSVFRR
jgi:hypothetical protein